MRGKILPLLVVLSVVVTLSGVACGSAEPTEETAASPEASVARRYRLKAPDYEEDYDQAIAEDYYLVLNEDGTVQFEAELIASGEVTVIARGTWELDGNGANIEVTELSGKALASPQIIRYEYVDGFPVATEYAAEGQLYNLEQTEFTIGAGERHPLVRELHQRLAAIDYLGFADPGDDLYTEETRKAVVAFQEAQGLYPNGEVNAATWVLLANPQPPTAVFCADDAMACAALAVCREHGLAVPRDMGLIGVNGTSDAERSFPALPTVHVPRSEIGARATDMLIGLIRGHHGYQTDAVLPVELLSRGAPVSKQAAAAA